MPGSQQGMTYVSLALGGNLEVRIQLCQVDAA
jgi:hypothetical protein